MIRMTPRIAEHDASVKAAAISRFLAEGHRVKLAVGIQKAHDMREATDVLRRFSYMVRLPAFPVPCARCSSHFSFFHVLQLLPRVGDSFVQRSDFPLCIP